MDPPSTNRPEMVEAAKKFMSTPKVRETPMDEQRQFLLGKGVREAEIDEALAQLPPAPRDTEISQNGTMAASQMYYSPPSQHNRVISFAQSALVIGSVSYAGYRFIRSYILPRFFDIPDSALEETRQLQQQVNELQNSMKFVIDSVSQTTQTLALQQEDISKVLMTISNRDSDLSRVETEISTIKSLLLSHNQFAPIKVPVAVNSLPSWQQTGSSNGFGTPPANFDKQESVMNEEIAKETLLVVE